MVLCAKMGLHFTACAPKELFPAEELVEECRKIAAETGATIRLTEDVNEGTKDADVLYTDIWVSMGEPDEVWESRIKLLQPYQVNAAAMANAAHRHSCTACPPIMTPTPPSARKSLEKYGITEMEVTDQVFESKQSVVFDEAENRMHTIKAVIYATPLLIASALRSLLQSGRVKTRPYRRLREASHDAPCRNGPDRSAL